MRRHPAQCRSCGARREVTHISASGLCQRCAVQRAAGQAASAAAVAAVMRELPAPIVQVDGPPVDSATDQPT